MDNFILLWLLLSLLAWELWDYCKKITENVLERFNQKKIDKFISDLKNRPLYSFKQLILRLLQLVILYIITKIILHFFETIFYEYFPTLIKNIYDIIVPDFPNISFDHFIRILDAIIKFMSDSVWHIRVKIWHDILYIYIKITEFFK